MKFVSSFVLLMKEQRANKWVAKKNNVIWIENERNMNHKIRLLFEAFKMWDNETKLMIFHYFSEKSSIFAYICKFVRLTALLCVDIFNEMCVQNWWQTPVYSIEWIHYHKKKEKNNCPKLWFAIIAFCFIISANIL